MSIDRVDGTVWGGWSPPDVAHRGEMRGLDLVDRDGSVRVEGKAWLRSASRNDRRVLDRVFGPVLDVGCGPGRHAEALQDRGIDVLGVDVSPAMVAAASRRGVAVVVASVFGPLPRMGEWQTALLLDGNSGLGGSPARLLRRLRRVLCADGRVITDLVTGHPPPGLPQCLQLRHGDRLEPEFSWSPLHARDLSHVAHGEGFEVVDRWNTETGEYGELRVMTAATDRSASGAGGSVRWAPDRHACPPQCRKGSGRG